MSILLQKRKYEEEFWKEMSNEKCAKAYKLRVKYYDQCKCYTIKRKKEPKIFTWSNRHIINSNRKKQYFDDYSWFENPTEESNETFYKKGLKLTKLIIN